MFYEELLVKNLLKCNQCNEAFDIKNLPKILKCGKTICSSCESKLNNKFKCYFCSQEHLIPANGLILNETIYKLVHEKPQKVEWNQTNNEQFFYKESIILNLLKCYHCNEFFEIYDPPVILLCGKSICLECNSKIKRNTTKCIACKEEHKFLDDKIHNEFIIDLYSLKPIELQRSKDCNDLKLNLEKLHNILKELNFLSENGDFKIRDYCDEQRRQIQLNKEIKLFELNEESIEQDDNLNEILFEMVNEYENECIKSYSNKKEIKLHINEMISETNEFISKTEDYLTDYFIDEQQILISNELCESILSDLNHELESIKGELFNNEMIKFNPDLNIIEFEPISFKFITGSSDRTIKYWNSKSNKCIKTICAHLGCVIGLKLFDTNKLVSASLDKTIKIWNLETGNCIRVIEAHSEPIKCIQMLTNNQLISCSNDKAILLWDLNDGNCLQTFVGHYDYINCVDKITSNEIVSGSSDCTIKIWNIKTGNCVKTLLGHSRWVWCLKVISNEKLISGSYDKTIKLWNLNSGECLKTLEGHSGPVTCVLKISNNKIASCSFDATIKIWDLIKCQCINSIQAHSSFIRCIVSLSSNILLSCSDDKTIKIWNLNNNKCLNKFQGHSSYVYSLLIIK